MELDITDFYGLDLTKEPDESWTLKEEGMRMRRTKSNSPLFYCAYDEKRNLIVTFISDSEKDDLHSLFKDATTEKINNHDYLVVERNGYKFISSESLLNMVMIMIQKVLSK